MGVFATRTPHRFNPIGLSIAKLEKVDEINKTVYLSGIDLIHGTPIIDIKPYHYVDSLPTQILSFPKWLEETRDRDLLSVEFADEAVADLEQQIKESSLEFYSEYDTVKNVIENLLALNPHSVHTIAKHSATDHRPLLAVHLDNV